MNSWFFQLLQYYWTNGSWFNWIYSWSTHQMPSKLTKSEIAQQKYTFMSLTMLCNPFIWWTFHAIITFKVCYGCKTDPWPLFNSHFYCPEDHRYDNRLYMSITEYFTTQWDQTINVGWQTNRGGGVRVPKFMPFSIDNCFNK